MAKEKTISGTRSRPAARARAAKTARVEVRTSPAKKALYQRAADLKGQTFTDFVETSLDEAAARVRRDFETMELTRSDCEAFVAAILSDAQPNRRLVTAAARYKERTGS